MKNKFLSVSIGITMMLFGTGFFIRSFSVAKADPIPENFFQAGTENLGKYRIHTIYDNSRVYLVLWDSETGKTGLYSIRSANLSGGPKFEKFASLPENPLEE